MDISGKDCHINNMRMRNVFLLIAILFCISGTAQVKEISVKAA
jgi:hypothetical protein